MEKFFSSAIISVELQSQQDREDKLKISTVLVAWSGIALAVLGSWQTLAQTQPEIPPVRQEKDLVASGFKRLTAAQIRQQVIGNTSYVVQLASVPGAPAGIVYALYYKSEKERVIRPAQGGGPKYTAFWWLEGDLICGEERGPGPVAHRCYAAYQVDSLRYSCRQPDGLCAAASRTAPGNPENL